MRDRQLGNIILIGPPGVGKSTVGVLLAKALSMPFIDTDLVVQAAEGRRLQQILDTEGVDGFREIEEEHVLQMDVANHVVATGGSVVYSPRAMDHLKKSGDVIFLNLPCESLLQRVVNLDRRAVVMSASQTFCGMYLERLPLYSRYADFTIDCKGLTHDQVVARIESCLIRSGKRVGRETPQSS